MSINTANLVKPGLIVFLAFGLGACSLTTAERTTLTGGAIGTAAGAGIAAVAGGPVVAGALIGGAAGATSGAIYEVRKRRWRRRR